jgi:hypothetical protein
MTDVAENAFATFVSCLTLAYHEARNVRHLIRAGHLAAGSYQSLVALPVNRVAAWRMLQPLRTKADEAGTGSGAEAVFRKPFGVALADLADLYRDPHWKHSNVGGNAWAGITERLIELRGSLDARDPRRASELAVEIRSMRHNTGEVGEKLALLDRALARQ